MVMATFSGKVSKRSQKGVDGEKKCFFIMVKMLMMIRTSLFHKVSNGVKQGSCGDDVGEDGYDGSGDADDDKNNLVSQGLQRGQTRESEAEKGSRQEFLQVVNSQRDR